jgi:hypothetical protein
MIKGLAITPPAIGRISIGRIVERNGRRLPEKDDAFTITTQVQGSDGWILHPLHVKLTHEGQQGKLRFIPVRLLFNAPDLNLRAQYALFDPTTGRPMCVGDGETARRTGENGLETLPCPGPDTCPYGQQGHCKLFGRLNVQIEGQDDDLGSFVFRSTGYNSIRTLAARLHYFNAVSGGNAKHIPLLLRLRAKSTTQSKRTPVYYVDLTLRDGVTLPDAVAAARAERARQDELGVATDLLEEAARAALANGCFEEGEDEAPAIVEEFYPEAPEGAAETRPSSTAPAAQKIRRAKVTAELGAG